MAFERAASLDDVWPGERVARTVGQVPVLLVNLGGELHAFEDRCAHRGAALSTGQLEGCVLTCSVHGWQYDLRTGLGVNPREARLVRYDVKVESDAIWVDVATGRVAE